MKKFSSSKNYILLHLHIKSLIWVIIQIIELTSQNSVNFFKNASSYFNDSEIYLTKLISESFILWESLKPIHHKVPGYGIFGIFTTRSISSADIILSLNATLRAFNIIIYVEEFKMILRELFIFQEVLKRRLLLIIKK